MDSVFGVSRVVSLTAWHCVGVQQPAVCVRESVSLRQTAGMCQPGDEWSRCCRALWTSCTVGLTCTAGLTCLWANSNSCVRFVSHCQGCLALTRRTDAAAQQKANVSSGIQHVVLNGSLWKTAGSYLFVLFCSSSHCAVFQPSSWIYKMKPDCPVFVL